MKRDWLESKRLEKGLSLLTLSKRVNLSKQGYWLIEKGKINPSVKTAKEIAKELNFSWTIFFE